MRIKHLVVILALLTVGLLPAPAHAEGVVTVCDEAHLLAALAGGGTVTFACSGTIILTNTITIAANTTIDGNGHSVTINGNNTVRVLMVDEGVLLELDRLTVANGNAGNGFGGGINNSGTLTVTNSIFSANSSIGGGGIANSSRLTVTNSTFSNNTIHSNGGGGIRNEDGTVIISGSTFLDNRSDYGDGGGGIHNVGGTLTVIRCNFSGNSALTNSGNISGGGGISGNGTFIVSDSSFSGNSAAYDGGGISGHGTLTVSDSSFSGNRAHVGGGISFGNELYGGLTVSSSDFLGNNAYSSGGGILAVGTLRVTDCTFSENSAVNGRGGGIWYGASGADGMMSVRSSTFSGNSAGDGGGISNFGNDSVVSNSTFSGNSVTPIYPWSDGRGAGIHNADFTLTIRNSTFSGNSASVDRGAGIYSGQYGTTTIKNTIIANNWPGANCAGTVTDGSGNLSYPDDTCPGINLNPRLYPLQDNGGPTETMALGPGSGALDAGDDATCAADPINNHDQRGHLRPKGPRCDIGAIEQEPYPKTWFPFASRR